MTFEVLKDEQWLFKKIKMGKGIQHTRIGTKRRQFRGYQEVKVGREGTPVPVHATGRLALKDCHEIC